MNKTCPDCKEQFYADEPWKRVCLSCYIKRKKKDKAAELESKIQMLERRVESLVAENNNLRKRSCGTRAEDGGLMDRWKDLMLLCHPDVHGGSERAHRVTVWLNEIRNR